MAASALQPIRPVFRAVARTVVPESADLDSAGWAELEDIVDRALAHRSPALVRQLRTLIRLIDLLPLARYGRTFRALDPARRERVLASLQDSRVFLLRRGFWGLRTLVFMGYYARPAAAAAIGYRADPRGWDARS